jgi:hypothetical protein
MISGYLLSGRALQAAQALRIPTVDTDGLLVLCRRITMLRSDGGYRVPVNQLPARSARRRTGAVSVLGRLMLQVGAYRGIRPGRLSG